MKNLYTINDAEKLLAEMNPAFRTAKEKAEDLAKTFQFNEVIKMLDALIAGVDSMQIASRYSPDRKIFSNSECPFGWNPQLNNMTEREYKKWQLKHDLTELKIIVLGLSGRFKEIAMDIEATKIE